MAKLNIDFILLDESVVMHGFRALMSGAMLEGFIKNPVMLLQHNRPKEYVGADDVMLPIGKWYDIRIEADKLLAKPDFDDADEFAQKIQKKVEGGYMNGASVWIEPTSFSEELYDMLPGQTLPTFTKWGLLEASIVDIPNCRGSLAIRNSAGEKILLSSDATDTELGKYIKQLAHKKTDMSLLKLAAVKLGLTETATDEQVSAKITEVMQIAATANENLTKLTASKEALEAKLATMETANKLSIVTNLVDGAIAAKKLAAGDRDAYIKLATADFDTTEALLNGMQAYAGLQATLGAGGTADSSATVAKLMEQSGRNLYMNGGLEELKKLSMPSFEIKYKEWCGEDYKA